MNKMSRRRSRREEKKSFCTWPKIFLLVAILAIATFLVWWFEPWSSYKEEIKASGGSLPQTFKPIEITTLPPTETAELKFMQCDENDTGNCCNGLEGLCDMRANEIMYATLHNGMSTIENGFFYGANHESSLEEALEAGYRGLNLDICNCDGEINFCHGICSFAPRDVIEVMQNVNDFLDRNPTEVIVFIFQVNNNVGDRVDLNQFYDQLLLVNGLVNKLYIHPGRGNAWPTLRELTDPAYNKRILMFHYNGPVCSKDPTACPDGLMQYYRYASENEWDNPNVASIQNRLTSCEIKNNGVNNTEWMGLNNFVTPPSQDSAKTLNEYSAATDYVRTCSALLETDINFLLVDFWSEGDLPRYTQDHNTALALQRRERKLAH